MTISENPTYLGESESLFHNSKSFENIWYCRKCMINEAHKRKEGKRP